MTGSVKLASRGSPLALWQAETVRSALRAAHPGLEVGIEICRTTGDTNLHQPLSQIGGVGLFTVEVDRTVLEGRADIAVHSLKDCPSVMEEGMVLGGTLERSSPFDAFLPREEGTAFDRLPPGSTIATGSLRRRAQILAARPDMNITELRGNIDTRLKKRFEPGIDAVIMAEAALLRLGIDAPRSIFDPAVMIPAVAQGIVGMAVRKGDCRSADLVAAISHKTTLTAACAERGLLSVLEGGCRVPAGAYARIEGSSVLLSAVVASLDGRQIVREEIGGDEADATEIGISLGHKLLRRGAEAILREIRLA